MGNSTSLMGQSFPPKTKFTAQNVPDLANRVVIVTGGNSGIGKETTKVLLSHNARVYIAVRNKTKGRDAIEELKNETGKEAILLEMDLADLNSVERAAKEFQSKEKQLHILFNNAAVMRPPIEQVTEQGYDLQFGTSVLGHFYFTKLLLPTLSETSKTTPEWAPRVVHLSSLVALTADPLDFSTFKDGRQRTQKTPAWLYSQSKLASLMLSNEFAERYGDQGVVFSSVNPGNIKSGLQRHLSPLFTAFLNAMMLYPVQMGAVTQLWAGTSEEGASMNGKFLVPWARYGTPPPVADAQTGKELWTWLEEQVAGR